MGGHPGETRRTSGLDRGGGGGGAPGIDKRGHPGQTREDTRDRQGGHP